MHAPNYICVFGNLRTYFVLKKNKLSDTSAKRRNYATFFEEALWRLHVEQSRIPICEGRFANLTSWELSPQSTLATAPLSKMPRSALFLPCSIRSTSRAHRLQLTLSAVRARAGRAPMHSTTCCGDGTWIVLPVAPPGRCGWPSSLRRLWTWGRWPFCHTTASHRLNRHAPGRRQWPTGKLTMAQCCGRTVSMPGPGLT